MYARIPVVLAFLFLFILAGAMHSEAALSAADRVHEVTLAQGPSERAQSVSDAAPVLIAPAPMRLRQGATADQTLFASDDDGDPIWFSKTFGPAYMTVTTLNAGSGSATGNVHLAPALADQGTEIGGIKASDGVLSDALTLEITVTPNGSPVLYQPSRMSGRAGQTIDQTLTATDPDWNAVSFFKVSGPAYMSVETLNASGSAARGLVHLSTTGSDAGSSTGTVGASDGVLMDQKSFLIEIRADTAPRIDSIDTLFVTAGSTADRWVFARDDDGDPIWFSKMFGPAYMTVTTLNAGSGSATGNVHLAPTLADQGTEIGGIKASDGALSDSLTLEITVTPVTPNRSPVLDQPSPMSGRAGETIDQTLTATDPDLNPLIAFKVSGPAYMSVQTGYYDSNNASGRAPTGLVHLSTNASGSAPTGFVHLSTTGSDAGSSTGTVAVTDGELMDQKSFSIEIRANTAPQIDSIDTLFVTPGSTVDRPVFASDDDGDPIWFSKTFGPAYMTVTTLNAGSGSATGNVHLAPTLADQGTEIGGIKASDGLLSDSLTLEIAVTPNGSPVLDQPSPMGGRAGETIDQTLTATDPDWNPLSFSKVSGPAYMSVETLNASGSAATGLVHLSTTGSDAGSSTGTVAVTDGALIDQKSFSIEIRASTVPQIFLSNSDRTVRLASGRPTWCVRVELASGHSAADVVLTSLVAKYAGGEARALAGSTKVDGDQDRNGIEEIEACFSKGDLRSLFAGLPSGHNSVTVAVEGDLIDGTGFAGDIAVDVVAGSGPASASVNPNPFNPRANLTFATSVPGQLRVKLYSLTGHLLRTLVDETAARAGYHDVTVDGLDDRGARLPSGIYFYKIETAEGVFTGRIAILK